MKKINHEIKKAYSWFLVQKRSLRVEHDNSFIVLYAKIPIDVKKSQKRPWVSADWEFVEAFLKKSRKS